MLARIRNCTFVIFVLNQKATHRSQRLHSLKLTIWVKGEEEKRDSAENNLGGGSTNFQGLFMTHAEKSRCPPTEASSPIGQFADFATLYRQSPATMYGGNH